MRKTLFRGKRLDNGAWVESDCIMQFEKDFINGKEESTIKLWDKDGWTYIDKTTFGEFIGLTDKNGKKIFEGDIVKSNIGVTPSIFTVRYCIAECKFQLKNKDADYGMSNVGIPLMKSLATSTTPLNYWRRTMDKEQQIETMAQTIGKHNLLCAEDCNNCIQNAVECKFIKYSNILVDAGYRKADEVRKETAKEIIQFLIEYNAINGLLYLNPQDIAEKYGVEVGK